MGPKMAKMGPKMAKMGQKWSERARRAPQWGNSGETVVRGGPDPYHWVPPGIAPCPRTPLPRAPPPPAPPRAATPELTAVPRDGFTRLLSDTVKDQ